MFNPRTAGQIGLPYLYHYQRFNLERLRLVIVDKKLRFSRPSSFNDPWDCRPCFDIDLSDDTQVEAHVAFFERVDRLHNQHLSEEEFRERASRLRTDRAFLETCVRQMTGIFDDVDRRYRVYCLAGSPIVPLMWAHYAASHSGVCFQFSADQFFGLALKVEYHQHFPSLSLVGPASEGLLALLSKSSDWQYEEEYRLVAQERSHAVNVNTLMTDDQIINFPGDSLRAIYLGARMPDAHRSAVIDLAREVGGITVRQMRTVPDRYALLDDPVTV